ncbi:MAG TPA: glycosyl hydrolase [Cyclobacteriaceae bacterium]|nr:glycosyl hydrolase [Cyclobacteriaceae bacterium]
MLFSRFLNSSRRQISFIAVMVGSLLQLAYAQSFVDRGWHNVAQETKPWTRWWWHGNAVTKEGITAELEMFKKAGLGGVEITPIYGVVGYEDKFVDFLSPQWVDLLTHTLKEGQRLDLGIDMATGTGWPFGGPWVQDEDACKDMNFKVYDVKAGSTLSEKIEFIQQPLLRAIGNPVYMDDSKRAIESSVTSGSTLARMRLDPKDITIDQIRQPVSANKNLQELALDQIKFEKPLKLVALMGYGASGETLNLFDKVDTSGKLKWTAPTGDWKLYAVFEGWHGKMVERAGPGGEGNVIDHFSSQALKNYLAKFDEAFSGKDIGSLRAFFNDSYEVDDARGVADWTPALFTEFNKRRGYDLRDHLPALFGKDNEEKNARILCDYRETVSELLLENFTQQWKRWAARNGALVRNQAHGSPSNILDLYAVVDIAEIEGTEPLRIKMASSAGNVTGKKFVSSESATWLNEHFLSNLSDVKTALDRFMLNGVNHIFYHGTCYSPPGEPWPGWLFYAAVHMNPRNPLWNDFDALNSYVARCQSFLQNTQPDNDVLLYYPIYDAFSKRGAEMLEHFDGIGKQFAGSSFEKAAEEMNATGYQFDFISDKQLVETWTKGGTLITQADARYQVLVIPHCKYIPIKSLEHIISLAESGAKVILLEGAPDAISGYSNYNGLKRLETARARLAKLMDGGRVLMGNGLGSMLSKANVRKEAFGKGIQFIRKKQASGAVVYMIVNGSDQPFDGWVPVSSSAMQVNLFDPMNGNWGTGRLRKSNMGNPEVYLHLNPQQTMFIELTDQRAMTEFTYFSESGSPISITGSWQIKFAAPYGALPSVTKESLASWTNFGIEYAAFSGTGTYTLSFKKPKTKPGAWRLDLGKVHESAEVTLNGKFLATLIGPVYQVDIDPALLQEKNILEVRVSNLMANRIADMDKRNDYWKKFYNVNIAARKPENRQGGIFNASEWQPKDSGLIGPVRLIPLEQR